MAGFDEYVLDRVAQPALDRLSRTTGISCFAVARAAFVAASACAALAAWWLADDRDEGVRLLSLAAAFEAAHLLVNAALVSSWRDRSVSGFANPQRSDGRVARLGALAIFLATVAFSALATRPGAAGGVLLWAMAFYGLTAAGLYAGACQPPPPPDPRTVPAPCPV